MPAESSGVVSMATLFDGFERVFDRWRQVEGASHDPAETFIPLFEVLEWTACIDERMKYPEWWGGLRGLRWARHRTRHDWAMALEVRRWDELVLPPPIVREPGPDEWAWRERLPEAKRATNRRDEPYYESHLAGQPARVTLNLLHTLFIDNLRPLYPPPQEAG